MPAVCTKNEISFTIPDFDPAQTFECGQAFRFSCTDGVWSGIVGSRLLRLKKDGDTVTFFDTTQQEFDTYWRRYLDLDTDYGAICRVLSADDTLRRACRYGSGIRILRQEPFETLITFILSQNNNIVRIKGLVQRLCEQFGEPLGDGFAFPTVQRLASVSPEDLAPVRAGFRAKYICDAARKVADGTVDLDAVATLPYPEARAELMRINGVGPKVADCTLLFGFHRIEAFPADVWIKRAMQHLYPNGLPEYVLPHAGIAQQYLFYYVHEGNGLQ